MVGGFTIAMMAIALIDVTTLSSLIPYATPLAALIFITLGFFFPLLSTVTAPKWTAVVPIVIALGIGVGMLGRGSTASDDLSLGDVGRSAQLLGAASDPASSQLVVLPPFAPPSTSPPKTR